MKRVSIFLAGTLLHLASRTAVAEGSDSAAARAQLQQGYALKQQGKCDEAIPHFLESVRLDRQIKALVNLADCEEKLGRLAAAQAHFVDTRDLAKVQGLEPLRDLAEQHLQVIERRMPKLSVRLAKDAPSHAIVMRDGVTLGPVSLGTPLPIDPGKHSVVVRGANRERQYDVVLAEAETKEMEVTPEGGQLIPSAVTPPNSTTVPTASPPGSPTPSLPLREAPESSPRDTARTAAYALLGIGAAGLVVGTVWGLKYKSDNSEIRSACPSPRCPDDTSYTRYVSLRDSASTSRTTSMIGFAAGGVGIISGAVLLLTRPPTRGEKGTGTGAPSISATPVAHHGGATLELLGTW
jgi:hypothetical protein